MSTIYRWRSGSPSFTVSVTNLASDNTGVSKVEINPTDSSAFTSNVVKLTSGGSAGASSYTGTITFKTLGTAISDPSGVKDYSISGTIVTWKSGGTCSNTTAHTIKVCEPATSLTLKTNNNSGGATVWSNASTVNLARSFNGSGTPYCTDSGTVKFVSSNTSYITIAAGTSYVTGTTATLVKDTAKTISKSTAITISGASNSASSPTSSATAAAATVLNDTVSITIKNAATVVSLSASDTHIYNGQTATMTATFTPHHAGTVYSTAIGASTNNSSIVSISSNATAFGATNSNSASLNIIGKGGGVATLTATYTASQIGIAGSTTCSVTCSSLGSLTTRYTYTGGKGTVSCSYDAISTSSNTAFVTSTQSTSEINTSNTITYTGVASGSGIITMKSGAQIVVTCSSLPATTTRTVYTSESGSTSQEVTFTNDSLSTSAGDTSYFTVSADSSSITVQGKSGTTANKTLTLNMRSGAKIVVNSYPASVGDTDVQLNVGDKVSVAIGANDSISTGGSTNYYTATKSGSAVIITAIAAGSGTITLASGLTIPVTVKNITVTIS